MKQNSKKNKQLCYGCDHCCRYVAIEIDKPTCKKDYDNIFWQLLHENVNIFIDYDNDWYVEFATPCAKLNLKTKLCTNYRNRPQVCRNYSQTDCVYYNEEPAEKFYFKNINDFKKYLIKNKINFKFKKNN